MVSDFIPKINPAKCTGCNVCVRICPNTVLTLKNDIAVVRNPQACHYTGDCQEVCPTGAISLTYEIIFEIGGREAKL